MKLVLVHPRGFCTGVTRAVRILSDTCAEADGPIYVLHEIVHNYWVVEDFKKRGVRFVESLDEIPSGSTVLFSAHGVSPAVREEARKRGLRTVDATCPLVASLHRLACRYAADGWRIFLIGHKGHQEVIGTFGEAPDRITLVSSVEEAETISIPETADSETRFTYLTQTTLSDEGWREIVAVLRRRFPELHDPPGAGACFATRNRQEAVRLAAPDADALLVVGSPNSSNSRRLAELGEKSGTRSFLINGPDDIDPARFTHSDTIVMTAGASAPEAVFQKCVDKLAASFHVEICDKAKETKPE